MSKLTFKDELLIQEARDPALKYTEKTKGKDAEKHVDRVIVELEGNQSGVMSRLTKRYFRLDRALKAMAKARDELNVKMKDTSEEFFDAEDVAYTRVVETCSFTVTLSKAIKAADKPSKISVDYQAIAAALEELVSQELTEKIEEIKKAYTQIIPPEDTPTKLTVKSKLEEGLSDAWKAFKLKIKTFTKSVLQWAKGYDKKLAALKKEAKLA